MTERTVAEVIDGVLIIYFDYILPVALRPNSRAHWGNISRAANRVKEATSDRMLTLRTGDIPQFRRAKFTYKQYWCGQPLDGDTFLASAKHVTDTVVKFGVVPDDGPAFVDFAKPEEERVPHRNQVGFELRVEEATP